MSDHLIPSDNSNTKEHLRIGAIRVGTITTHITGDLKKKYRLVAPRSLTLPPSGVQGTNQILEYIGGLFESGGHLKISQRKWFTAQLFTDSLELINWLQQIMICFELQTSFRHLDAGSMKLFELTWCGIDATRLFTVLKSSVDGTMDHKLEAFASHETKSYQ